MAFPLLLKVLPRLKGASFTLPLRFKTLEGEKVLQNSISYIV